VIDQSKEPQQLMLDYIAKTEATGELPLLDRKTHDRALTRVAYRVIQTNSLNA
jgi:hypothetical protein